MKNVLFLVGVVLLVTLFTPAKGQGLLYDVADAIEASKPANIIWGQRHRISECLERGHCSSGNFNKKAYERAKKRYLKRSNQDRDILDCIDYVDRFYAETLDELAVKLLTEARELIDMADGEKAKLSPWEVHRKIKSLRYRLEDYRDMGIREKEMSDLVSTMTIKMQELEAYSQSEAYSQVLFDNRKIIRAEVHDQVSEDRVRVACYSNYGGTVYQVNLIREWSIYRDDFNQIISMSNQAMVSFKDKEDKCWLVVFNVEREHAGGGRYMEPSVFVASESKQPMPCENVNR